MEAVTGSSRCPWDVLVCSAAAYGGHVNCLQYAHDKGYEWHGACLTAAHNGHVDCLQYAHSKGCPWDGNTCNEAVKYGNLECLQYAHENGCPWDENVCAMAVRNGHLHCLQYAHENGCPWHMETHRAARSLNQLQCLQYALANGCPWDVDDGPKPTGFEIVDPIDLYTYGLVYERQNNQFTMIHGNNLVVTLRSGWNNICEQLKNMYECILHHCNTVSEGV